MKLRDLSIVAVGIFVFQFTYATSKMCESLFSAVATVPLVSNEKISSTVFSLLDLVEKQSKESDANQKTALSLEIDLLVKTISASTERLLADEGISYQAVDAAPMFTGLLQLQWPSYKISPEGNSHFNRLAKRLDRTLETSIIYDPIGLELTGGNGAFISEYNALYVSSLSLTAWPLNYVVSHEIRHAYFNGVRRGKVTYLDGAPVHIVFQSKESINPMAMNQGYTRYASFEELITHAHNIEMISRATIQNRKIPGVIGNQMFLNNSVMIMLAISENTIFASDRAHALLESGEPISIQRVHSQNQLVVKSQDESFQLSVFVNDADLAKKDFDQVRYFKNQLDRAKKLAAFNLNYFPEAKSSEVLPVDPLNASTFRASQRAFLRNL